jgi:glycosyltransferase involved in cell wall biosynthesis
MNLKVAFLTDKPLPEERGTGIGVRSYNLAKSLSDLGITVHLFCRGENQTKVITDNFVVHKLAHFERDNVRLIAGLHRKEKIDILHTTTSYIIPALLLAKAFRIPSLFHYAELWQFPPTKIIQHKIMFSLSDKVVCVSNNTRKEVMEEFHVDESKLCVIYSGVDIELFKPIHIRLKLREEFGLENFSPILLTVGVLQKRKGQHYVIESLPYILKQFPHCCYVNVGGFYSPERIAKLKNLAAKLKVEGNVRFLKPLPQAKLVALINLADVCIHPALHEGFSLALAEEMACKKPVVAFNNSSIPEIIEHMKNGVLIKTGDIVGLASAIIELLSNRSLSNALAENARKRVVENFTWQKTATEIIKVYEQMVTKAGI